MRKIPAIRAMIFDFDGTLARLTIDFDLMKKKIAATASALLDRDLAPPTLPALEWIEVLGEEFPEPEMALEFKSRARLIITAMELDAARSGELFDFTRPLLRELDRLGVPTGIITRNCTPAVLRVFPDLADHCSVFLPREAATRVKPHPDHFLAAARLLGVEPGHTLMIGDHYLDIETAKNAGALSGAVATGNLTEEELASASPDFLAPDSKTLTDRLVAEGHIQVQPPSRPN